MTALAIVTQFDGSALASKNCFAAEGAMLVATETGGQKHPTAAEFRSHVRNLDAEGKPTTPDVTGGGRPSQIVETARRAYGVSLDLALMPFEEAYALGQRSDVTVGFAISYAPVSGTVHDGSPGFRGLHGICMNDGEVYDPLADARRPGIPQGPETWPKGLLQRACEGYTHQAGMAAVIIARAPAVKPKRYIVRFDRGAVWTYPKGAVVHHPQDRFSFARATSAPCTAPFTIPWAGGQKRVVEVTAGVLMGRRVEPGVTHVELVTK